jgi:hypothetical protein
MLVILKVKFVSLIRGGRFLPPPIISGLMVYVNGNLFPSGSNVKVSIHLIIELNECLLGFIVKAVDTNLDCLFLVTEDAIGTNDVNQAAGADNFLNTTIIEGFADDVCPVYKTLTEVGSNNL